MWPRVVEFMLGCWLAMSPIIFRDSSSELLVWSMDWSFALLIVSFALLSYWRPLRHLHLATAVLSLAMVAVGRFYASGNVTPEFQNYILVGLLLLMFALVPNDAGRPPRRWHIGAPPTR